MCWFSGHLFPLQLGLGRGGGGGQYLGAGHPVPTGASPSSVLIFARLPALGPVPAHLAPQAEGQWLCPPQQSAASHLCSAGAVPHLPACSRLVGLGPPPALCVPEQLECLAL